MDVVEKVERLLDAVRSQKVKKEWST